VEPDLKQTVEKLEQIVRGGRHHCAAWRAIYQVFNSANPEILDLAVMFFGITARAHLDSAILQSAKLTENRSDSLNLNYLFNLVERDTRTTFRKSADEAFAAVKSDKESLRFFASTIDQLKLHRDRFLAHYDRRNLREDIFMVSRPSIEEIERFLAWAQQIVEKYAFALDSGEILSNITLRPILDLSLGDLQVVVSAGLDAAHIPDASDNVQQIQNWRVASRKAKAVLGESSSGEKNMDGG